MWTPYAISFSWFSSRKSHKLMPPTKKTPCPWAVWKRAVCAWNPSRIITSDQGSFRSLLILELKMKLVHRPLNIFLTMDFLASSPPGTAEDLQLPIGFPTDLIVGSQQEFTSPDDQGIHLVIATRTAWIAIIKQSSCTLWLHYLAMKIPISIVVGRQGLSVFQLFFKGHLSDQYHYTFYPCLLFNIVNTDNYLTQFCNS